MDRKEYRIGQFSIGDDGEYFDNDTIKDDEAKLVCDRCGCDKYIIHESGWGYSVKCTNCGLISHIGD